MARDNAEFFSLALMRTVDARVMAVRLPRGSACASC
jgi:hypothetical protein